MKLSVTRTAIVLALVACGAPAKPVQQTADDPRHTEAGLVRMAQLVDELCRCYALGQPCDDQHDEEHAADAWLIAHEPSTADRRQLLEQQLEACANGAR